MTCICGRRSWPSTKESRRGGVGLLIVESPTIDYPRGVRWKERYRIDDDKYIQGLSELVDGHP